MAIGRAGRRKEREPRIIDVFGARQAPAALDLLELVEMAWHDCYAELSPSDEVVENMLILSNGDLGAFVQAARLALTDQRDLKLAAEERRGHT